MANDTKNELMKHANLAMEVYVTLFDNNGTEGRYDDKIVARGTMIRAIGWDGYLIDDWVSGEKNKEVTMAKETESFTFCDDQSLEGRNMKKLYEFINSNKDYSDEEKFYVKTCHYPGVYSAHLAVHASHLLKISHKLFYPIDKNGEDPTNGTCILSKDIDKILSKYKKTIDVHLKERAENIEKLISEETDEDLIEEYKKALIDLKKNVAEFKLNLNKDTFTFYTLVGDWPTLLNPSPFQPII